MKIYGRGSSAQSSAPTDSWTSWSIGDSHHADFIQTCQDNPSFLCCIFLFPEVKTALKGKRFQDNEDMKKNVLVELNAILWRPLLTLSKKNF
jgi:hypothetical protein